MTVYVDDMHTTAMGRFGRMKMSHMIADSREELLKMAAAIGVNARWLQHPGESGEHFDIALSRRSAAVEQGAVEITMRQCSAMCARRRVTGQLGTPEDAERWRLDHWHVTRDRLQSEGGA